MRSDLGGNCHKLSLCVCRQTSCPQIGFFLAVWSTCCKIHWLEWFWPNQSHPVNEVGRNPISDVQTLCVIHQCIAYTLDLRYRNSGLLKRELGKMWCSKYGMACRAFYLWAWDSKVDEYNYEGKTRSLSWAFNCICTSCIPVGCISVIQFVLLPDKPSEYTWWQFRQFWSHFDAEGC